MFATGPLDIGGIALLSVAGTVELAAHRRGVGYAPVVIGSPWCEVGGSRSGPGRAYLDAVADSARPPVIEKYARVLAAADV